MNRWYITVPLIGLASALAATASATSADEEQRAQARAESMLERVGGRSNWAAARSFYVKETGFLPTGEVVTMEIWRDLETVTRRLRAEGPTRRQSEVIAEASGWRERDGKVTHLTESELAEERQGLRQEPYQIYYRLAKRDPKLRVELVERDKLNIYEGERLLCWFILDGKDNPVSWGNLYNGAVNQHWYGPLERRGPVFLPKWGAAIDGRWRFEYVDASLSPTPLEMPKAP